MQRHHIFTKNTAAKTMKMGVHVYHRDSTGAAPRPFERRPVPEGRKFRRWRQPQRLSERPQGASCAEGSDRRNFQAGVTGRRPFLLLRFLSVRHGKKMKGPWNRIPKTERFVNERTRTASKMRRRIQACSPAASPLMQEWARTGLPPVCPSKLPRRPDGRMRAKKYTAPRGNGVFFYATELCGK